MICEDRLFFILVPPTSTQLFGYRHLATAMSPKTQDIVKYLTRSQMANDEQALRAVTVNTNTKTLVPEKETWRRACGCIKTSEKLRQILMSFPTAPPPTPPTPMANKKKIITDTCISACCQGHDMCKYKHSQDCATFIDVGYPKKENVTWSVVAALVSLVQHSVTATALVLYYLIYCYMQLVYCTLKTALYFHNADGPMKITIGVMTLTSLVVGFNILLRMERLIGIRV